MSEHMRAGTAVDLSGRLVSPVASPPALPCVAIEALPWVLKRRQFGQPLTAREREVLMAVALHGGEKHAADELGISVQTVKNHVSNMHAKLGTHTTASLVWIVFVERAA